MAFPVRVLNNDGEPVGGVRVRLAFTSPTRGMSDPEYTTDSNGEADFDSYDDGEVEVFLNGSSYSIEHYSNGDSVEITL